MKKFWLVVLYTAGAFALWRYYEYRKEKDIRASVEEAQESEDVVDDNVDSADSSRSDILASNANNRVIYDSNASTSHTEESAFDYRGYYIPAGAIGPMSLSHDEANIEKRRAQYEETGTCDEETGEEDLAHITSGDPVIDGELAFISRRFDLKIWMVMSELYKMPFRPILDQAEKEGQLLKDIREQYELRHGSVPDNYYGTYGEIFMWFAENLSWKLEITKTSALEDILRHGKFFDSLYIAHPKKEVRIDPVILEQRANMFAMSDYKHASYNIFGSDILAKYDGYDEIYNNWISQMNDYIEMKLAPNEFYPDQND